MARLTHRGYPESRIGLIFAYPERNDIVEGQPLSSRYGRFLKHALYESGIKPRDCYIDYLCPVFPGRRGLASIEAQDEVDEYKPELRKHIREQTNLQVVVLFGPEVLPHFKIEDSLAKVRGFVFDKGRIPVIPTYHPRAIFAGLGEQEVTFMNDLEKAARISLEGFTRPAEDFILGPSYEDVRAFLMPIIREQRRIYVDIEAVGSLNERDRNEITMVGVGCRKTGRVLVIPFLQRGGTRYWPPSVEEKVHSLLTKALTSCPGVFP